MGSDSKGGSGAKSYDYFGTVVGVICRGQVDAVQAVIVDGKQIVTGPVMLTTDATNLTLDPGSEEFIESGGRLTIYRGSQTQTTDADLTDHPPYHGTCYLVAVRLLFGRERTTAPNIQVIVSRKPEASTDLVLADDNEFTALDGSSHPTIHSQCNPVAALAELLTSPNGLGIPVADLDSSSWQAAGTWAAASEQASFTHCSPVVTSQDEARRTILTLLEMFDGALYWTSAGKLAVALLKPGVNPGGLSTIDARHFTERHKLDAVGWIDVPTSVEVKYPDRTATFKERSTKADNLIALQIRGSANIRQIDRPHITGTDQASRHAVEVMRRLAQPVGQINVMVRRPIADGYHPGSKLLVDVDPEPGGGGLAQLCVVEEMTRPDFGDVRLVLRPDTLVDSIPYSPEWTPSNPQGGTCPPIDDAKAVAIPLPAKVWTTPSIAVLTPRPAVDVVGFRAWFGTDTGGDFADLGQVPGFSARVAVGAAIDTDDVEVILTLPETDSGPDAYLVQRFPGTEIGAQNDELLLVLANLDGSGRVVITDGRPEIEIASIQTRALVGSDMVYTILRGRQGSIAGDWDTDSKGWVIPRESLRALTHPDIRALIDSGDTGYVRMVAYTAEAEDDTVPIPEIQVVMPTAADQAPRITWTSPSGSLGQTDGSGDIAIEFSVADPNGDLVNIRVVSEDASGATLELVNQPFAPTHEWSYSATHRFAIGVHKVTVIATDDRRNATVATKSLQRLDATGSASILAPTFTPPGGSFQRFPLSLTISSTPTGRQLQFAGMRFDQTPATFGSIGTTTAPQTFPVNSERRVWARVGDGVVWGEWVYADYRLAKPNNP